MDCKKCKSNCCKWGRQKDGTQRYYYKDCKLSQQEIYRYQACSNDISQPIKKLVCIGVGIRGIAVFLNISINTVIRKIKLIANGILKPPIPMHQKCFELDEVRTFIHCKENQYWIAYALCSETKRIVDFIVGKRSKRVLKVIVDNLVASGVGIIKTDKLNIYQSLIPSSMHISNAYNINHIERNNLNLRTHLKRLSRRTICFSRSVVMLEACLKIYFWK